MLIPRKAMKVGDRSKATVLIPSISNSYSLGMEFITQWFFKKIDSGFFKSFYMTDKSAIAEFRKFDTIDALKKNLPSLSIDSRLDMDYLHESDRLPDGGMDLFLTRTARQKAFFDNPNNNIKIAMESQTIKILYTFKMKVKTKSMQMDLVHYLRQACRVGESQTHEYDMDFHIPMELMVQLAMDMGFEVKDGRIVDVNSFLYAINNYSYFPFTYKIRTATQNMEFFVRVCDISFYVNATDNMSVDEGERINMVTDNFIVEMPVYLIMSAPKMYVYYSESNHSSLDIFDKLREDTVKIGLHGIHIRDIPETNCKGWVRFITADYSLMSSDDTSITYEDDTAIIELRDLIKDTDVEMVYNYAKRYLISPSTFMDFRLVARGQDLETTINWDTLTCKVQKVRGLTKVGVILYLNKSFVNERILQLTNADGDRINKNTRADKNQ